MSFNVKRELQAAAALEAELNKERASGLGLTGKKLEDALAACAECAARVDASTPETRKGLVEEYRVLRLKAEQLRWYMCIQREAMGLRRHDDVDRLYPPPRLIKE